MREILNRYTLGELTAVYRREGDVVELLLVPAGSEGSIARADCAAEPLIQGGVIYLLLCLLTVFVCWLFVGRNGVFGAKVDWISQHSVIPDYFRQQFYDTGELFPEFAANLGGGQNIYNFSYYGLYSPVILLSYLLPFVKMSDYIIAVSIAGIAVSVCLLPRLWHGTRYFLS